jgi:hypothetical protein
MQSVGLERFNFLDWDLQGHGQRRDVKTLRLTGAA